MKTKSFQLSTIYFSFLVFFLINNEFITANYLNGFDIDTTKITTSGVASGGSFASQLHIAYSSIINGVGIIGGAPYYCASNSLSLALTTCMSSYVGPSVTNLYNKIVEFNSKGLIDDVNFLKNDHIYIYSGTRDTTVKALIVKSNGDLYSKLLSSNNSIKTEYNYDSASGMVTNNFGSTCGSISSYSMNNCGYQQAFDILNHLYLNDNLKMPKNDASLTGTLEKFDQTEFIPSGSLSASSFDTEGYIYIPSNCRTKNSKCKLHVVFHGCNQNHEKIGEIFVRNAGYNEVADINNIIVVYPQVKASLTNANSCFDWWGYTGSNYANKNGIQMMTIRAIIDRLLSESSNHQTSTTTLMSSTTSDLDTFESSTTTMRTTLSITTTTKKPSQNILDDLDIDSSAITTSGISSGGSMAIQLDIAYSSIFRGVGTIAGPGYYCAQGSLTTALINCMQSFSPTVASTMINKINEYNTKKTIDDITNLKNHRVYIFSGKKDTVVPMAVVKTNEDVYSKYVSSGNIKTVYEYNAVHGISYPNFTLVQHSTFGSKSSKYNLVASDFP